MPIKENLIGQVFHNRQFIRFENGKWIVKCLKCGKEASGTARHLKNHGCHCSWKNTVNENYFQIIDCSDKAYFLGFLFADGYVSSKQNICKIDLQECDVDFLEKFKEYTKFSGKINQYIAKKGKSYRPEDTVVKRINIINKKFIRDLEDKGVYPHREKEHFPFKAVPEEYYLDFIRGYFDGNGSILLSKKDCKYYGVNFCGGTNMLSDIDKILSKYNIIFRHTPRRPENKDNDQMFVRYKKDIIPFLDLIYTNASVYLNRKYNKYIYLKSLNS